MTVHLLVNRVFALVWVKNICHSLSHSCISLRSVCSEAASCWSRMTLYSRQSSAKSRTEEETLGGRSLMYTRNRRDPNAYMDGLKFSVFPMTIAT